jgi:hypothetical protein
MSFFEDRFVGVGVTPTYFKKILFQIAMGLLIIGGLTWLLVGLFDVNIVTKLFGESTFAKFIYILVGVSAVAIMCDRDTYLPFLGSMVAPCSVLENKVPPGSTRDVKVITTPNTKVIYWAAEPATENLKTIKSWNDAYLKFENAGVATSNGDGVAVLKVRDPQPYKVPLRGRLERHIHYRACGEAGFLGKVETVFLDRVEPEGFASSCKGIDLDGTYSRGMPASYYSDVNDF